MLSCPDRSRPRERYRHEGSKAHRHPFVLRFPCRSGNRDLETVLAYRKFQIVVPHAIRQALGIEPGQRLQAFRYGDRVELVRFRPLAQARGFLAGLDSRIDREADRV